MRAIFVDKAANEVSSLGIALAVTLVLRVFYSAGAALLSPRLVLDPDRIRLSDFTENLIPQSDALRYALLGVWERFDTLWYLHVADVGYDCPESVVFPPLYPLLIRIAAPLAGSPLVAALIVSTLASLLLFWAFHRLAVLDMPPDKARRAVLLYGLWPPSFIFFAGYPDSLTIALMLSAIVFARSERWWLAATFGFLAGLAKAVGFLVVVPLAVIAWRKRSWKAAGLLLSGAGYALYAAWLFTTGRMLPAESYERFWGTHVAPPWETVTFAIRNALNGSSTLRVHLPLGLTVAILSVCKRVRLEYVLFALAALLFVLTKKSDPVQNQLARYLLILFPAPLNLALLLTDKAVFLAVSTALLSANLMFFWAFLNWSLMV
jgi:hypothetical protein